MVTDGYEQSKQRCGRARERDREGQWEKKNSSETKEKMRFVSVWTFMCLYACRMSIEHSLASYAPSSIVIHSIQYWISTRTFIHIGRAAAAEASYVRK